MPLPSVVMFVIHPAKNSDEMNSFLMFRNFQLVLLYFFYTFNSSNKAFGYSFGFGWIDADVALSTAHDHCLYIWKAFSMTFSFKTNRYHQYILLSQFGQSRIQSKIGFQKRYVTQRFFFRFFIIFSLQKIWYSIHVFMINAKFTGNRKSWSMARNEEGK